MMAKPMKTLELHYPMIRFLIITFISWLQARGGAHSGQTGCTCAVPPKTFPWQSLKLSKIFAFKPKVKTVAEKLSFKLRIWPRHLVMDILKSSQLVIFSHKTIFITFSYRSLVITFSYRSLVGFVFKLYEVRGGENRKWRWIFAFDRCVGAGQKTPEIFVYASSNKKWRHIRSKLSFAARFTKRENGVLIAQDFAVFVNHQFRFSLQWKWTGTPSTFLRLFKQKFLEKRTV